MKLLDLFAGIGGFSLGLERAGMNTVGFCEQDQYCLKILNKHWPDVHKHTDINTLTGEIIEREMGKIDVISGGFPCQPFSHAGQQQGQADDRHLWPQMLRIITDVRPTWVIAENVTGLIKLALDDVLHDLEGQGYTTQSFVIPAASVGAIHRRDRVWIIAHTGGIGLQAGVEYPQQQAGHDIDGSCGEKQQIMANTISQGLSTSKQPGTFKQNARPSRSAQQSRYYRDTFKPIGMPTQPAVCPRNDGLPDRVARLKALGNSVVPQIPELIGRAIMQGVVS